VAEFNSFALVNEYALAAPSNRNINIAEAAAAASDHASPTFGIDPPSKLSNAVPTKATSAEPKTSNVGRLPSNNQANKGTSFTFK